MSEHTISHTETYHTWWCGKKNNKTWLYKLKKVAKIWKILTRFQKTI